MNGQENIMEIAVLKWDGGVRGPDDTGIETFVVDAGEKQFWFEAYYIFLNSHEFRVRIENLFSSGSSLPEARTAQRGGALTSSKRAWQNKLNCFFLTGRGTISSVFTVQVRTGNVCWFHLSSWVDHHKIAFRS
jgi:hypothetical protein